MPDAQNWTVITTIATSGSGDAVYADVWAFHQALAKKYGKPMPKWYEQPTPFICQAGPSLRWYHSPDENGESYKLTTDLRQLTVYNVQGTWLQVLITPPVWVRAEDCRPK